ncbi:DNA topoisomerase I, mitochondrial isoform X1 [Toxorhynchites rutilus septentrionalis]|uniref:DNA topoisomerase I, mitochondrial isoform X1 n=1 Tax=Toxorhynchites rutilus septentrionalis TaxID=329112 RepID=UPI00247B1FA3|nr:DNA topoisomerase I, mitochondrial isoform X1 [Toxorhynchites rutilus septentrionalis]
MSVEAETANSQGTTKHVNGGSSDERPNGITNGHSADGTGEDRHKSHKSSSKDKHRDKDRDRDKHREKDKHRSDKDRDKQKSSSSSSSKDKDRDKHKSSSSSSSNKDRDKDRDRDRHSSSHKSSKSDKDRDREKDKDRSKDKERSKDKDKERSRDKDREKDKDRKDRDKDKSSSSKDKDKHKSSSSSSSSHRDKDKERDKHKSSSSSSGRDKEKHSSSSGKDKDRKDRDKHSSSKDKDRERKDRIKEEDEDQPEVKQEIKEEPLPNGMESNESSQDVREIKQEDPLDVSQASSCDYSLSQFRPDETPFDIKEEAPDPNSAQDEDDQSEETEEPSVAEPVPEIKQESDSEDDVPLSKRKKKDDDEDFHNSSNKKKKVKLEKKEKKEKKKKRAYESDAECGEEEEDYGASKKKTKKIKKEAVKKETKTKVKTEVKQEVESPTKGRKKKKEEEEQEVWKWWEEEKREDGVKWNFLEHKGPVFAPPYEPLPSNIKFEYDGKEMKLSQDTEEIAGFYARMLEHDYTSKDVFNDNFFKDWRKAMTSGEREKIKDLKKCNFRYMKKFFDELSEKNRNRTKEEKLKLKEQNEALMKEYGTCIIDGHKEKIGNFKIEPPGLFRGRGEHPKMGLVKRRVMPEDVIINCAKNSKYPEAPEGHRWKEVRHDNTVSWLASWTENVQGQVKYVMLNPSSKLKGEKDWQKYETARRLLKHIDKIRETYHDEWKSKEMRIRQRAVALYFIDKLALRAGNEKDEDQADTVGCCSLRVEHIELHKELNGKENVVVFDFLGKDSIRYYNEVEVEKRVFKNLELFKENKKPGDDLFDRLNTTVMNEHLRDLMDGLTAKVFRTFNASFTLQNQLAELTDPDMTVPEKLLAYNRANRAVAILCNHQRAVPKTHDKSMSNLKEKIRLKREAVDTCQRELKDLKKSSVRDTVARDKKTKQLERLKDQLMKLELQETDKDENKTIALGTSKLNYLDPRISVAWCKKFGVPIEKIFNKTQRDKFRWAIDMADETYVF